MSVPSAPRYVTVEQMWDRSHVDTARDLVSMTSAIVAAEIAIDTYCGRSFEQFETADTTARYFRARSARFCRIDDTIDVATVQVGFGTQADTFSTFGGEYVTWDCNGGAIDMLEADSSHWPTPRGWVKVTPTTSWGWPAVPGNVTEATAIQALRWFKRPDAPHGVMGFDGEGGTVRVQYGLDADVKTLVTGWRRREKVNP